MDLAEKYGDIFYMEMGEWKPDNQNIISYIINLNQLIKHKIGIIEKPPKYWILPYHENQEGINLDSTGNFTSVLKVKLLRLGKKNNNNTDNPLRF